MRVALLCLVAGCAFQHGTAPSPDGQMSSGDGMVAADGGTDAVLGASMVMLRPDADTWIREQFPTEVHGSDVDLRTGSGSSSGRANRLLVHFDLGAIPTTCVIAQARLSLYFFQEDFTNVSPAIEAHRVTASWSETSATWASRAASTAWSTAGGDFASASDATTTIAAGTFGWIAWDLTALATRWRSGADPNYGVVLLEPDDEDGGNGRKLFYSMQSATTTEDRRPYLRVLCN